MKDKRYIGLETKVEDLKKAIDIIQKETNGYRDDLIKKVGSTEIVDELAKYGCISQGVTKDDANPSNYKRTWGIVAEKVEEYARLFSREISDRDKSLGRYLYSIGVR